MFWRYEESVRVTRLSCFPAPCMIRWFGFAVEARHVRMMPQRARAISLHWFSAAATPPTHTVAEQLWLPAVPNARLIMGVCMRVCTDRIPFHPAYGDAFVKSCMVLILLLHPLSSSNRQQTGQASRLGTAARCHPQGSDAYIGDEGRDKSTSCFLITGVRMGTSLGAFSRHSSPTIKAPFWTPLISRLHDTIQFISVRCNGQKLIGQQLRERNRVHRREVYDMCVLNTEPLLQRPQARKALFVFLPSETKRGGNGVDRIHE